MKKVATAAVFLALIALMTGPVAAQYPVVYEHDFNSGTAGWTAFGSPSPTLVDVNGTTILDPSGDGWCNSGVYTNETFDWGPGSILEFVFVTNPLDEGREGAHQSMSIGICSLDFQTGTCSEGELIRLFGFEVGIDVTGGCGSVPHAGFTGMGFSNACNGYGPEQDGVWHHVKIQNSTGASDDSEVLYLEYDGVGEYVELDAPLPSQVKLQIAGRSNNTTLGVSSIKMSYWPDSPVATDDAAWGSLKALFR